jgi:hypothetical protein
MILSCHPGKNQVFRRMHPWQKNNPREEFVAVVGGRRSSDLAVEETDNDLL